MVHQSRHSGKCIILYDPITNHFQKYNNYIIEKRSFLFDKARALNLMIKEFDHVLPKQNITAYLDDNNDIQYKRYDTVIKNTFDYGCRECIEYIKYYIKHKKLKFYSIERYYLLKYIKKIYKLIETVVPESIELDKDFNIIDKRLPELQDNIFKFVNEHKRNINISNLYL